jgi:hypothetical protein
MPILMGRSPPWHEESRPTVAIMAAAAAERFKYLTGKELSVEQW